MFLNTGHDELKGELTTDVAFTKREQNEEGGTFLPLSTTKSHPFLGRQPRWGASNHQGKKTLTLPSA